MNMQKTQSLKDCVFFQEIMDSLPSVENDNSKDEKSKRTAEVTLLS